ncbi:MAG: MBOAT family protein [Deltaproteobacteria bacterium]|nr:MBOAT family protein [Deltaproteobacteria bacterium]
MVQELSFWLALLTLAPAAWLCPARWRPALLAAASALVLAPVAPLTVALLAAGVWVGAATLPRWPRAGAVAAVALLGGGLLAAKAALAAGALGPALPLGLSFFCFRLVHYVVEARRGALPAHRPIEAVAWVLWFPIFTAGPIWRFGPEALGAPGRPPTAALVAAAWRLAWGLVKRFALAELLVGGGAKDRGPAALIDTLEVLEPHQAWLWVGGSFLRLYLDFSGYSDIAIGASGLFGVTVGENFRWPMFARSPADFWRRWHISLSAWCQAYLYLPLLGLSRSPTLATFVTFALIGLWHGVSGPFLLWGLAHGAAVAGTAAATVALRRRKVALPPALGLLGPPLTLAWAVAAHGLSLAHGVGDTGDALRIFALLFGLRIAG